MNEQPQNNHSKVISMSLYGKDPRYTWGAIRNAQLLPIIFPGWTLRVYVPVVPRDSELYVPPRIIACLKRLGAQTVHAKLADVGLIPPRWWRYLVVDDTSVDYFLIRDADSRLSERDAMAVSDWMSSTSSVHCIRDLPSHASQAVVDGLWGGKPKEIRRLIGKSVHSILLGYFRSSDLVMSEISSSPANTSNAMTVNKDIHVSFLEGVFWPLVSSASICHDSVSCRNWTRTLSFPDEKPPADVSEYVGQKYNEYHDAASRENRSTSTDCRGRGKVVFSEKDSISERDSKRIGNPLSRLAENGFQLQPNSDAIKVVNATES